MPRCQINERRPGGNRIVAWRIVLAVLLLALRVEPAFADFEVCNDGDKVPIKFVWATREVSIFSHPFDVHGWFVVAPGDCETVQRGAAVDGYEYWLHAVAKGVTLTADFAQPGTPDDQQFCISSTAMDLRSVPGNPKSCEAGEYVADFPIWNNGAGYSDITVHLHPDSVSERARGTDRGADPPPSLYGALAIGNDGRAFAQAFQSDRQTARDKAIRGCNNQTPQGSSCSAVMDFADRCMAMFTGDKNHFFIVTGNRLADAAHTVEWGLQRCKAHGNTSCKQEIVLCSTSEAQAAERNKRNADIGQHVIEGMGKAIDEIYRQGNR